MAELRKSCSNCLYRKNRYEFGDSGRITFFCYCCMMDGRNKFKPDSTPKERGGGNGKRYIDADKLIEHIKDLPTWWADGGGVYGKSMKYPEGMFDCEDIISSVENQPTADVAEVKHGEQIRTPCSEKDGDAHCSECNHWDWSDCKYCSECGAKMDGKLNCKLNVNDC